LTQLLTYTLKHTSSTVAYALYTSCCIVTTVLVELFAMAQPCKFVSIRKRSYTLDDAEAVALLEQELSFEAQCGLEAVRLELPVIDHTVRYIIPGELHMVICKHRPVARMSFFLPQSVTPLTFIQTPSLNGQRM
jgi:hypothetical protein